MNKLLLLLFSLLLSLNSYGEWVYIDKEKNSDAVIYVQTDSIEFEDGYVYWTYLNNYSKPRSEYNIMGLAIFRGGDCVNNRYMNIESEMFQGSMGSESLGGRIKHEQEWTTPSSGQIDEKILNYVCNAYPTHTSDDVINPTCESKDINEELDRMWVKYGFYEMEVTAETIEEKDFLRYYKKVFEGILRQRDEESIYKKGYYCCSNSSLEVCQELKELE